VRSSRAPPRDAPGAAYSNPDPIGAISTVPLAANLQILLGCAVVELTTLDITYGDGEPGLSVSRSPTRRLAHPGDYGWDPAKVLQGKSQAKIDDLKLKELSNGRLAMMAFLGMCVQNLYFHKGLFEF